MLVDQKGDLEMIDFNVPPYVGTELEYINQAIMNHKICGDGEFTRKCNKWIESRFGIPKVLLTTSGSAALDIAALLCDIKGGDEVILPSFTFSSTANAFVLAGARLVFIDIRPDTMNLDESKIEGAITDRTKAICVMHYAGVSCEMNEIMRIAQKYHLLVVEDSAQGIMSTYEGKALGSIGSFGCFSFHETKNYSMGEGGAILINDESYIERAEILREKGTDRSKFLRGQIDKYTWVDFGDSYLPSEINAAYLWGQLEKADEINNDRMNTWEDYYDAFRPLAEHNLLSLPFVPENCNHNAHMFYIKLRDAEERSSFLKFMRSRDICCTFHYVPLHSAPAGMKFGRFSGEDQYTTRESERLVRLPLYYGMSEEKRETVKKAVFDFFS